ncbi:dihydroorotase [Facklamia sp. DSM 111018]|uniref:Dihydroorotase n=1 Tax=Facklamia lactis TaxID=2749967 RepID=A0ABS0LR82_9LACT|nr:dihydroorotase [Facklamia lactis]MBG9980960.1 dihydroorotase [Facklamia lactis]MBG9986677.1 dihydroorotase [Facklamia lactis]
MLLIKNVNYLNRAGSFQPIELLIEKERIILMGESLSSFLAGADIQVIDGQRGLLSPGFIDLHVHFRQPGGEAKETIETGSLAAAKGGFTQVCAMPNLNPVPDTVERMQTMSELNQDEACIKVHQYSPISKGLVSETDLVDFEEMVGAGAIAFTNDGLGVQSAGLMFEAMNEARQVNRPLVAHTEDNSLLHGGVMHAGRRAKELHLPGIASVTESSQIARDCALANEAGCHYHVCHVSTKESVEVVRAAKAKGVNVTCEVCPHHLILCDEDIPSDNGNWKMNPPLRGEKDRQALIEGLLDGTIDCIATDHAPHTEQEKNQTMLQAPFGIIGSELAFPLLYTHFVLKGIFTLEQLINWLTILPARIFNLESSQIEIGSIADLVIIDLKAESKIQASDLLSKSKNTPFIGWKLTSRIIHTIYQGEVVYSYE